MDDDTRTVTVCAACLQASCRPGAFYWRALGLEHEFYWTPERERGKV